MLYFLLGSQTVLIHNMHNNETLTDHRSSTLRSLLKYTAHQKQVPTQLLEKE